MRIPNFFIFGPPKCGTTSIAAYLSEHPLVFMSVPKEPHYFAFDLPGERSIKNWDDYLNLFKSAGDNVQILGEASVYYLYSKMAAKNIYEIQPEAKIVVLLRNPVDMVYSLHNQLLLTLNEDVPDFITAWEAQDERILGNRIPRYCKEPMLLQYKSLGSYAQQLKHLFKIFPESQVKVLFFDDFKKNPSRIYEDILAFIGVPSDGRSNFEDFNPSRVNRSRIISIILNEKPLYLRKLWKYVKIFTGATDETGEKIGKWIRKRNFRYAPRRELRESERKLITDSFMDEIEDLEELLGLGLTSWKNN